MKAIVSFFFLLAVALVTSTGCAFLARLVYEALLLGWGVLG